MKYKATFYFMIIVIVFFGAILAYTWYSPESETIKEVPCYDKWNNEIQGVMCEENNKIDVVPHNDKIYISYTIVGAFIVGTLAMFVMERRMDND
jgi:hypothetical protein